MGQSIHKNKQEVTIDSFLTLANTSFAISSVICHRGNLDSGHYYTLLREGNNVWVQLDDESVYRGLTNEHAECKINEFAYMCIYKAIKKKYKSEESFKFKKNES